MRKTDSRSYATRVEKGGKLSWPCRVFGWKVGQRVYFSVKDDGILVSARPDGLYNGRILSTRITKKFSCKHFRCI